MARAAGRYERDGVTAVISDEKVLITNDPENKLPAILQACASVGIEEGKTTGDMLAAYFEREP